MENTAKEMAKSEKASLIENLEQLDGVLHYRKYVTSDEKEDDLWRIV